MRYLSKHFLSSANISLSIYKNAKISRAVPLLKSKFHIVFILFFYSMMDIKMFTTEGGGGVRGGEMFFRQSN